MPSRTASRFIDLLGRRAAESAFHPAAAQRVLRLDPRLFAVARAPRRSGAPVLAVVEVSGSEVETRLGLEEAGLASGPLVDLVSGREVAPSGREISLRLRPYQVLWLRSRAD